MLQANHPDRSQSSSGSSQFVCGYGGKGRIGEGGKVFGGRQSHWTRAGICGQTFGDCSEQNQTDIQSKDATEREEKSS